MKLTPWIFGVAALAAAFPVEAAVGVPENIVLYRDPSTVGPPGPVTAFIQDRLSPNDFSTSFNFLVSGVGGPGDGIEIGDVNGDGIDDIMAVQNPGPPFSFNTIAGFTLPGDPPVFPGAGAANATRAFGTVATDTIFARRRFDADPFVDSIGVINELLGQFNADVYTWYAQGSDAGPFDPTGTFYGGGAFGTPGAFGSIPLVGDFNGDGVADRMVHDTGSVITGGGQTGRVPVIDFSAAPGAFGDALGDTAPQVLGLFDTDELRAADINGDGLDDLVVVRPDLGFNAYILEGWINTGVFDPLGGTPTFQSDPNFNTVAGVLNAGDTIQFGAFPVIPEPTTATLLTLAAAGLACRPRR